MSDAERWQRVKNVFQDALERAPDTRAAFLAESCGDDPELRREVESMLAVQGEAEGFLSRPALSTAPDPNVEGRRIGPYRVLGRAGQGGMGVVYRAVRDDDVFEKTVAIKLVRGGATDEHLARLTRERQILARLQHPHIATILDGGTTEEGQPYLVMEYVDGTPIDVYCDAHRLGTRERLQLFRTVCLAVHYAHQNLVVHRDLKPGNVVVTPDGQPKLLDFGIAKLVSGVDPDEAPTATLLPMMTPEYASPEQVRGQPVTTASDVYSLGVVLYELLTGSRPYVVRADSLEEIVQAVCGTEPRPPSAAASTRQERATRPSPAELRGDLDTIVLKAMRKEPARRYLSALELAEDVRRHLEERPVQARRDTWRYRSGKFVGRHRLAVAAGTLLALSLVGGAVMTARQARLAEVQRRRAEESLRDVRRIANALIFEVHDAVKDLPGATPARETIVKRALEYLARLEPGASDPALKRELAGAYERIGDVQGQLYGENLGRSAEALASYRRALALRESITAAGNSTRGERQELAIAYRRVADLLRVTGDRPASGELYRKALLLQEGLAAENPADADARLQVAGSRYLLADWEMKAGNTRAALEEFARALQDYEHPAIAAAQPRRSRYGAAVTHYRMGSTSFFSGDLARARAENGLAVASLERLTQEEPANPVYRRALSMALHDQGLVLRDAGDPREAVASLSRAGTELQAMISADPKNVTLRRDLMLLLTNLGVPLAAAGQPSQAVASQRRALTMAEELSAADPANMAARQALAAVQVALGETLVATGRTQEARELFGRALAVDAQIPAQGRDNQSLSFAAGAHRGLGLLGRERARSRPAAAEEELRQACDHLAKSRDIWLQLKALNALSRSAAADLAEVSAKLATCPAATAANP